VWNTKKQNNAANVNNTPNAEEKKAGERRINPT